MNDVNLNSPDLRLVRSSDQAPARASASPRADGRDVSAQSVIYPGKPGEAAAFSDSTYRSVASAPNEDIGVERQVALTKAVSQLNDFVQSVQRDLQFEVDNELGKTIVRVVDQETSEVIRQIPDEVALRLAEKLQQDEPLTLFNVKV